MKKNKIISLFLAFMIILSIFPTTIFATTANTKEESYYNDLSNVENSYTTGTDYQTDTAYDSENVIDSALKELSKNTNQEFLAIPENSIISSDLSSPEIIDNIKSFEDFSIKGTISSEGEEKQLDEFYDFSKTSKFHIAHWAYEADLISEQEMIDCLCDLVIDRNFENIYCLEEVFDIIQSYEDTKSLSMDLLNKIDEATSIPIGTDSQISTFATSTNFSFRSTNFIIYYGNSELADSAQDVALYFERVRNDFIQMGFKLPLLQSSETRLAIYLDEESKTGSSNTIATTFKQGIKGVTCSSYIVIYNFENFNDELKSTIAHEYFHTIQNAYNHDSGWFKEACANWGAIIVTDDATFANGHISNFINNVSSMDTDSGYGATVFPLTIHRKFGGSDAILEIYEEYSNHNNSDVDLDELRTIITNGISNNGYSGGFDLAFRAMTSFLYDSSAWYHGVFSNGINISNGNIINVTPITNVHDISRTLTSGTIPYLSSAYFNVNIPSGFVGTVKVDISFSSSSGTAQLYAKCTDGAHYVSYYSTDSNNKSSFFQNDMGNTTTNTGFILSNLASSGSITYTGKVELIPKKETFTFASYRRYMERVVNLDAGEYAEFKVTFATSGSKIIQTFGEQDTVVELYSTDGTLLLKGDDTGYNMNGFVSYNTTANTQYIIRVRFYSSSNSGAIRLGINPAVGAWNPEATSLDSYKNIFPITSYTGYTFYTYSHENYTRMVTYTPPSSGSYTFEIESEIDTYVYVIDPRSNDKITSSDYNDDSGEGLNAKLTKSLDADVPYLVIYSGYNPSVDIGDLTLKINKNQ